MSGFNPFRAVAKVVSSVASVAVNVVKSVIKNPLPVIETIALNAIAPGFGSAIGSTLGVSEATGVTIAKALGSAAISAANGGSLANIATAGLIPLANSPAIQQSVFGSTITGPSGIINSAVTDIIKDPTLAKIVSGAIGTAATSGLVSAVTGGDILKTMTSAGISSAVANSIGTMWSNLRSTTPKLTTAENEYSSKYNQIKDTIPLVDQAKTMENGLNTSATTFNDSLTKYNDTKSQYDDLMTKYNDAKNANNIDTANSFADQINNSIAPKLTDLANQTNSFYDNYQSKLDEYKSFMNNNADAFNTFNQVVPQLNTLQNQYDVMTNQIQGDYLKYQLTDAIKNQDFVKAADLQKQYNDVTSAIQKLDPTATLSPSFGATETDLLQKIESAPNQVTKYALMTQAKADPIFKNIISSPTTSYLQNAVTNLIKQGTAGAITSQIMGGGSGTPTPRPTTPVPSTKPPAHVDISLLKPVTKPANIPTTTPTTPTGGLTQTTTPTTTTPTTTTPITQQPTTGGLNVATTPTNTATQTPISGLQSTTPSTASTAPTKVDVSTLTPVTDPTKLKTLGLA